MNTYIRIGLACFAAAILYLCGTQQVYAATVVGQETYTSDKVWDSAGSPYILTKTVTLAPGTTLTIKEGVSIISSTTPFGASGINVAGGKLFIKGKGTARVSIKGVTNLTVTDGYAEIVNTDMQGGTGLSFTNSRVRIATSTIKGMVQAIKSKESIVSVEGSYIKENSNGIRIIPPQIILVDGGRSETGGIGNALDGSIPVINPSFSIVNSSISSNATFAIGNFATYPVDARNNWWGGVVPLATGVNRITGQVSFDPTLSEEPSLVAGEEIVECCSSVLFIPGFQGTRLHAGGDVLWEPHNNGDVRELYLNADGTSINPDVYAGTAIDKAYGLVGVYDKFLGFLGDLKNRGTINEWKVFGYDWRMPIAEVVAGTKRATTTDSLVAVVQELAARSRTGKVAIVAHSNGGLVSKYLISRLAELGKESLIDTMISVAVPYLGTPEAILGLLHGDNQELLQGVVQENSTARSLGKNMPGVYGLLPSAEYFRNVFAPTVVFASSTITGLNDGSYPKNIRSHADQVSFLLDDKNVRADVAEDDIVNPLKANQMVMGVGEALHAKLDAFMWPSHIARFGISGWNAATAEGVTYRDKESCAVLLFRLTCEASVAHVPNITMMGDATVVSPSATFNTGTHFALDLKELSVSDTKNLRHATIMEASTTQSLIRSMLTGTDANSHLPKGVSAGAPEYSAEKRLITVSTHSPVELHIYDSFGNHTGPTRARVDMEEGFSRAFENAIPGSTYRTFGNADDPESYIYLPNEDDRYSFVVRGTVMGVATLKIVHEGSGGEEHVSYNTIPVTPLTILKTSVTENPSDTAVVTIDADGDGTADAEVYPGSEYDPLLEISLTRTLVSTLLGSTTRAQYIDKKLAKIADQIGKGKLPQVAGSVGKVVKKIGHLSSQNITAEDRELIIKVIEGMIAQIE